MHLGESTCVSSCCSCGEKSKHFIDPYLGFMKIRFDIGSKIPLRWRSLQPQKVTVGGPREAQAPLWLEEVTPPGHR